MRVIVLTNWSFRRIFIKISEMARETVRKCSQISKRFFLWEFFSHGTFNWIRSTFSPPSTGSCLAFWPSSYFLDFYLFVCIFFFYFFFIELFPSLWRNKNPQQWIRFPIKLDHVFLTAHRVVCGSRKRKKKYFPQREWRYKIHTNTYTGSQRIYILNSERSDECISLTMGIIFLEVLFRIEIVHRFVQVNSFSSQKGSTDGSLGRRVQNFV